MNAKDIVLYDIQDVLDTIEHRDASTIITRFGSLGPHSGMPSRDKYKEYYYGATPIGYEIEGLMQKVLEEEGIWLEKSDDFSLFRLNSEMQNQFIEIPPFNRQALKAMKKSKLNTQIEEIASKIFVYQPGQEGLTQLEEEFVYVRALFDATRRFEHAYFTSFKSKKDLSYERIQDAHYDSIWKVPRQLKKKYGKVEKGSILEEAAKSLVKRSQNAAEFQFSDCALPYAEEYTILARLPKYLTLNHLFVPEKRNPEIKEELSQVLSQVDKLSKEDPRSDFVIKWKGFY